MRLTNLFLVAGAICMSQHAYSQEGDPKATELWEPVPKLVSTGAVNAAPSDAIVLFDGKDLKEWVSVKDTNNAAKWTVGNGAGKSYICYKQCFQKPVCKVHLNVIPVGSCHCRKRLRNQFQLWIHDWNLFSNWFKRGDCAK